MTTFRNDVVIAVSGKHRILTQAKIEGLIKQSGAAFTKVVDSETTHLVTTDVDYAKKSPKVTQAEKNGAHIVTLDWLTGSVSQDKQLPEDDFLFGPSATPATQPAGKAAKRIVAEDENSNDEEKPAAKKPKTVVAGKRGGGKKDKPKKTSPADDESDEPEAPPAKMKTVIKKGKVPVDETCPIAGTHHVYVDDSGVPWDATLNQADISRNNNKFYYCQLLESDTGKSYAVFCHWGRVGESGQSKMYAAGTYLSDAMRVFDKQMKAKTGKTWENRQEATGGNKKYAYLERNYDEDSDDSPGVAGGDGASDEAKGKNQKPPPEPSISPELVRLMELIFNASLMQQSMASLSYDANKLPLGRLSKDTIMRGYVLLKQIGEVLADPVGAAAKFGEYGNTQLAILNELTSRTIAALKREAELVENLVDMKISSEIISSSFGSDGIHPIDKQFSSLGLSEAVALDHSSKEFEKLEAYVKKTHGHTHYIKLVVEEIFRVTRSQEDQRWKEDGWDKYGNDNRKLLWHGSRTTNFAGILSQGLRIAPPEAPATGYMFDKGIYLADIVTKSANYCCPNASNSIGLLLLCEAQLGDPMYECKHSDSSAATNSRKAGSIATKGLGHTIPKKWEDASVINEGLRGVQVPKLSGKEADITGQCGTSNFSLEYNEYIVYNVSQVKIRYLFRCRFN